jgi:hypothetical protein
MAPRGQLIPAVPRRMVFARDNCALVEEFSFAMTRSTV